MTTLLFQLSLVATVAATVFGFAHPGSSNEVAAGESLFSSLLWLVAAIVTAFATYCGSLEHKAAPKQSTRSTALFTGSWLVCLLCVLLATAVVGWQANMRFACNAAWQWFTSGCIVMTIYLLLERCGQNWPKLSKRFIVLGIAIGWVLAMHGTYQKLVEIPADIARYEANPAAVLREVGIDESAGPGMAMLYKSRLYDAAPTATYSLTNSLAIVLAISLVLLVGWLPDMWRDYRPGAWLLATLCALPLLLCLLWTKSRTAWLAVILGAIWMGATAPQARIVFLANWKRNLAFLITLIAIAVSGIYWWDSAILRDALDSLFYRTSYWYATIRMITDHGWLGVGGGNFQDYYAQYKPILSAETVSDPHNFLIETTAVGGLLAGLSLCVGLLMLVGTAAWLANRPANNRIRPLGDDSNVSMSDGVASKNFITIERSVISKGFLLGVAFAIILPWAAMAIVSLYPDPTSYLFSIPVACVVMWYLSGHTAHLPSIGLNVLVAAMITYVACLSFAGGWMTPGVTNYFFVLVALMLKANESLVSSSAKIRRALSLKALSMLVLTIVGVALPLFLWSAWWPVRNAAIGIRELVENSKRIPSTAELRKFVALDAIDPNLWRYAAQIELQRAAKMQRNDSFVVSRESALLKDFNYFCDGFIRRNQQSWSAWTQRGHWHFELAGTSFPWLELAAEDYARAAQLYPSDVDVLLQSALAYFLIGNYVEANRLLASAEFIDQNTPHFDRRIFAGAVYWPESFEQTLRSAAENEQSEDHQRDLANFALWNSGRQPTTAGRARLQAEPLAKAMRKFLDSLPPAKARP